MQKYILLLVPIFLLIVFIWTVNDMNASNTEPTFLFWFSLLLSVLISIQSILGAVRLFKKSKED